MPCKVHFHWQKTVDQQTEVIDLISGVKASLAHIDCTVYHEPNLPAIQIPCRSLNYNEQSQTLTGSQQKQAYYKA